MQKRPITYAEKVYARFVRRGPGGCWIWEGSMHSGRPALNLRQVNRFIYEIERGPIPPGWTLWKQCHSPQCGYPWRCRHMRCVNPWHELARPIPRGVYKRERQWDSTSTAHINHYKQQQTRQGPGKEGNQP